MCPATVVELTPEILYQLNEVPQPGIGEYADPVARALWEITNKEKLALRRDQCGAFFHLHKCARGHKWRVNSSDCGMRICCEYCSKKLQLATFTKFLPLQRHLGHHHTFEALELEIPCVRSQKAIRRELDKLGKLCRAKRSRPELLLIFVWSHANSVLHVRLIYRGPLHLAEYIGTRRPDIHVEGRTLDSQYFGLTLERYHKPTLPSDPRALAELEVLFKGTRLVRASGTLLQLIAPPKPEPKDQAQDGSSGGENVEGIPSMDSPLTDNPPQDEPDTGPKKHRLHACRCPECGEWSVERSEEQHYARPMDDIPYHALPLVA